MTLLRFGPSDLSDSVGGRTKKVGMRVFHAREHEIRQWLVGKIPKRTMISFLVSVRAISTNFALRIEFRIFLASSRVPTRLALSASISISLAMSSRDAMDRRQGSLLPHWTLGTPTIVEENRDIGSAANVFALHFLPSLQPTCSSTFTT